MLLTDKFIATWHPKNKEHYINKGYSYTKFGDTFGVNFNDIYPKSTITLQYKCDYCNSILPVNYVNYRKMTLQSKNGKDCCRQCTHKKIKEIDKNVLNGINIINTDKHGLITIIYNNKKCWSADQLQAIIGGSKLGHGYLSDHKYILETDYAIISDKELIFQYVQQINTSSQFQVEMQRKLCLLYESGLKRLLYKTRRYKTREFAKKINTMPKPFLEGDFVEIIMSSFKQINIIHQYHIQGTRYKVDLYIPEYNIVIEFDEHSNHLNKENDQYRQSLIIGVLNKSNSKPCRFFRYETSNPYDNPGRIINEIINIVYINRD